MNDPNKKIVNALAKAQVNSQLQAEARALRQKLDAINTARAAIYSAISAWTGEVIRPGDPIPVIRNGRKVSEIHSNTLLHGDPTDPVTSASLIEHRSTLERKEKNLCNVKEKAQALISALTELSYSERIELDRQKQFSEDARLASRIIAQVGYLTSSVVGCSQMMLRSEEEILKVQKELKKRQRGKGRPRNDAAYAVASELAYLYANVTGQKPTYSEGPDGLSGQYTPALRDVFDSLGWTELSLRGPAEAAILKVGPEDLAYDKNQTLGGLLGLPPE